MADRFTDLTAARGYWVAVAKSTEVGRFLLPCEAGKRKLVVFRRRDGAVAALEDECWHRLLPLSNGELDGDDVVCAYHGMTFAPDGRCVRVRLGRVPDNACVRTYETAERDGLVWVMICGADDGETGG